MSKCGSYIIRLNPSVLIRALPTVPDAAHGEPADESLNPSVLIRALPTDDDCRTLDVAYASLNPSVLIRALPTVALTGAAPQHDPGVSIPPY